MTVRVYSHETVSVTLTYGTGGAYPNLKALLVTCLVNGGGGIPGAGWSLVYDEGGATGTFVLANGAEDLFVAISYNDNNRIKTSMAVTFEGVDGNGLIVGEGARSSYSAGAATSPVLTGFTWLGGQSASNPSGWCVIADETAVAFTFSAVNASFAGPALDSNNSANISCGGAFGFGRTAKGLAYCAIHQDSSRPLPGKTCYYLEDPQTGFLIPSSQALLEPVIGVPSPFTSYDSSTEDFEYEDLMALPVGIYVPRLGDLGRLKGFLQLPHLPYGHIRWIMKRLGMAPKFDTMQGKDIATPILGSNGSYYSFCKTEVSSGTRQTPFLITDSPEVW